MLVPAVGGPDVVDEVPDGDDGAGQGDERLDLPGSGGHPHAGASARLQCSAPAHRGDHGHPRIPGCGPYGAAVGGRGRAPGRQHPDGRGRGGPGDPPRRHALTRRGSGAGSGSADEAQGPPGLVQADGGGVSQVERAVALHHGDAQVGTHPRVVKNLLGQAGGLRAEQEGIVTAPVDLSVETLGVGGEGEDASRDLLKALLPGGVDARVGQVVVVQAGTTQLGIVHVEQRIHEVEHGAGIGAQADRRPSVARDTRKEEDDVQHEDNKTTC